MSIYSTRKSKKSGPSGAPGPATERHFRNCQHFCRSFVEGGPFGEKTNFQKKFHNAEKLKGGTLWDFKHPICCKISKKLKGGPFGEKKILEKKSHNAEKLKGWPFGVFQHPFCRKTAKKLKGKFSKKKSRSAEKN